MDDVSTLVQSANTFSEADSESYSDHQLCELLAMHEGIIQQHEKAASRIQALLENRLKSLQRSLK